MRLRDPTSYTLTDWSFDVTMTVRPSSLNSNPVIAPLSPGKSPMAFPVSRSYSVIRPASAPSRVPSALTAVIHGPSIGPATTSPVRPSNTVVSNCASVCWDSTRRSR